MTAVIVGRGTGQPFAVWPIDKHGKILGPPGGVSLSRFLHHDLHWTGCEK